MTKSRYKGRLRIKSKEEFNQLLCLGYSTNVFCAFDTIRSPCSIRFEPLRSLFSNLRLEQLKASL